MSGNFTLEFENWLSKKNHVAYAVTCHSGTQALEILASYYRAYFDEQPTVALPAMTYIATANALAKAGWSLNFIDVDRYGVINFDYVMKPRRPDLLVLVGLYGTAIENPNSNMGWAQRLAWKDVTVIEDAAQHWLSDNCTRRGRAAAVSFDPTKNLNNYGNGGAILTDDRELFLYALSWRDNGKSDHQSFGTNSRMSEIDCAQLLLKTQYLDSWQKRRREIAEFWILRFRDAGIRCLIDSKNFDTHAFHKFVVEIDHRDMIKNQMSSHGIDVRVHYTAPLHEVGFYRQFPGPNLMAASSSLSRRVLSLPFYPELTDLEVEYIADQLTHCVSLAEKNPTSPIQNSF